MSFFEVRDIKKSFGQTEVLRGITFTMEKGEVLTMIGSSGSGKTTLLRCINYLETPDSGQMLLDGKLLFDGSSKEKRSDASVRRNRLHFGLVFQSFNLFPQYNAFENITLAPKMLARDRTDYLANRKSILEEIDENANRLLLRVGLSDKGKNYPGELSGGQQQRVAIARALALRPDILCFDEPTSALDPELTQEVLNVIRSLKGSDSTMIVVTHEMEFARGVSDRVIYMSGGKIEESGTPDELFNHPKSPKTQAFLRIAGSDTFSDKAKADGQPS